MCIIYIFFSSRNIASKIGLRSFLLFIPNVLLEEHVIYREFNLIILFTKSLSLSIILIPYISSISNLYE